MASLAPLLSVFFLSSLLVLSYERASALALEEINLAEPTHGFNSLWLVRNSTVRSNGGNIFYDRVHIVGLSRFKIKSYASSFHVIVKAFGDIPERYHSKLEVCFHGNTSLGLGDCVKEEWNAFQDGQWTAVMSPYGDKFLDIRFPDGVYGSITVSIEEEFQLWRLVFLGFGFALLIMAPIVSSWAPFYYSSSMVLGVLLVVLIILFQGMKLLPTGRKGFLYLTLYGSIVGAGSYLVHYFSLMVNSILVNFGLNEEMHNPVSVFLLVGITLSGAALGYWAVRKFVLSSDGTVDAGIALFVKWAMRIFALVFTLQSSADTLLAMVMLAILCVARSSVLLLTKRLKSSKNVKSGNMSIWQIEAKQSNRKKAEFLSCSPKRSYRKHYLGKSDGHALSSTPPKAKISSNSSKRRGAQDADYYSTFHKTPIRRRFSKKEWENFTEKSTKDALAELAATPDFSDWMAENAHRIHLSPEVNSDESTESGSGSDSSEATSVSDGDGGLGFFHHFLPK